MSAETRAIARALRAKRRKIGLRRPLKKNQSAAERSLFADPKIQAGLLEAGLHIADALFPGTAKAFEAGIRKSTPAPESQQIQAPDVINVHRNKSGVYE
jgi:hypothetical protein